MPIKTQLLLHYYMRDKKILTTGLKRVKGET
jgi:hypothetical protein